jgi:hypothetical protein
VPRDQLRRVLLVTDGDPYLETALTYLPNTELYGVTPANYGPSTHPEKFDLIVFDANLPATLPATPILAIAPNRSSALGDVAGTLKDPGIGSLDPDEPILRYVDLSTTHIAEAKKLVVPAWARTVIGGPAGAPLLYAGDRAGLRSAVLAFEPRRSDLPLQVAFPILVANLAGELMGASSGPNDAVKPSDPVSLAIPSGATGLHVTRPDGTAVDLVPGTVGGTSVTFSQTEQPGLYTVTAIMPPTASGSPGTTTSTPAGSPTASASASVAPSLDPTTPFRFAVDLFDVAESNIAPGSAATIAALGRAGPVPGASGAAASPSTAPAVAERPAARDELWGPILLIALAALCVEWAVYQRDALVRVWRGIAARRRSSLNEP